MSAVRIKRQPLRSVCALLLAMTFVTVAARAELRLSEGTNLSIDVAPADGRIVMDLLGSLWALPARGGDAQRLLQPALQASKPRWSPDGASLLFESRQSGGSSLWQLNLHDNESRRLTPAGHSESDGDWHPSGERIVYAAATQGNGIDLYERDLATGLTWRLTSHPGDEAAPAWSADGRHLAYVLHEQGRWYLMLRRFGQPPQVIHESATPLHAPAWRPDNTLLTFLARDAFGQLGLYMAILAEPPLVRLLAGGEDFFLSPVAWRDRFQMLYTADGVIKARNFDGRASRPVTFSAGVGQPSTRATLGDRARPLPTRALAGGTLVIRATRMFDGFTDAYRHNVDIVIENGRITALENARQRDDVIVIDVGDSTVMPGLIDTYAALPGDTPAHLGPLLLTHGVTTLVTPDLSADAARKLWQEGRLPGPRVLVAAAADTAPGERDALRVRLVTVGEASSISERRRQSHIAAWRRRGVPVMASNWSAGLTHTADLLLGTATLPVSPAGRRYGDVLGMSGNGPLTLVSGLADAATRGVAALHRSAAGDAAIGTSAGGTDWPGNAAAVVVGSRPSGLQPGVATQAELLALRAAGLPPHRVLAAATGTAAATLRVADEIGRIEVGARADLILLAGDPLKDIGAIGQVIGVVRDGHFFSAASLREQAASATVE